MELPIVKKPEKVETPAESMEKNLRAHAHDIYGEYRRPEEIIYDIMVDETNRTSDRLNAASRLLDKVVPTPKAEDERGAGGISVTVLGEAKARITDIDGKVVEVASTQEAVERIRGNNDSESVVPETPSD